jgi:protein kinase-like protein
MLHTSGQSDSDLIDTNESSISLSGDLERQMVNTNLLPCQYEIRTQSSYFHDDTTVFSAAQLIQLLKNDLTDRVTQVGDNIAGIMFPDSVFGFPINDQFMENFYGSFLTSGGILDPKNFYDDKTTAVFLNRMISTISHFLNATGQVSLKPLRYFSAVHSSQPLPGHQFKRKPDIMLLRLVNGYLPCGPFDWSDLQGLVEHTREKKPPMRLPETVTVKSYLTFCSQPERDYVVSLCIIGDGFHIVMTDHVGQVETDVIAFNSNVGATIFIRMLMGLAFLPDNLLGVDTTMTREGRERSNTTFAKTYTHFSYVNKKPSIQLFGNLPGNNSLAVTSTPVSTQVSTPVSPAVSPTVTSTTIPDSDNNISTISLGSNVYKVIRLLFRSQTLIGRATRAFLVQFPDGRCGVLKDSWITKERGSEASFLSGLDIPYGPDLVDHGILRNTDFSRKYSISPSPKRECREKRRIVTYPAGVHISDFTSLLELIFAFFDIVLCMWDFFISFALLAFLTLEFCDYSHVVLGD